MSYHYGIDKEIHRRIAAKYDPEKEAMAQEWIEKVIEESFSGGFQESLKSGVRLCRLINCISPNSIKKYNTQKMPFMQMVG